MRQLPSAMQAILNAGPPFTAENRPQTRITVLNVNSSDHSTHTWDVTPSSGPVGNRPANKLPIWWYMDDEFSAFDNALEIPNIKQVVIDRQLLQGAATIQVEIYNAVTPANGSAGPNPNVFGDPGYFAYARGLYADGNSRWNFTANEWQNQLRENALLYVWQGYGGEDLPLANAIADGYLILDGVFLVDTCAIESQTGLITLTGRDMGKLLVDQYAWPPVVPQAFYGAGGNNAGITYYITGQGPYDPAVPGYGTGPNQTVWSSQRMVAMGADGFTNGCSTPAELVAFANDSEQLAVYQNASSDATNGSINACNGDVSTEWISPTKTASNDFTYIQFACGEEINGVYLDPYLPGVMCYVSIIENGAWVDGAGTVNGGTLVGTIPYVANFGLGTAQTSTNSTDTTQGRWYPLPLTYTASVVQLTFTNLQEPQPGDFAAGLIGDCALGQTQSITGTTKTILDISPTPDGGGYRLFGTDGGVFDYGDSIYFGSLAGQALNGKIIGGDGTADNQGYWMCGSDGGVYTFGDAVFYGSLGDDTLTAPIVAFRSTPSGNGYYMCGSDGAVYCFGDASYQGRQTGVSNIVDITIHPDNGGYWLLGATGSVYSFGDVAYHGGLNTLSPDPVTELGTTAVAIDSSGTGGGYRIATALGGVYTFGDAVYYPITGTTDGTIPSPLNSPITGMRRTPDDQGYWLVGGDGGVFTFGDALFIGALPASFALQGNYSDYAEIVADFCLWAGFWLYPSSNGGVVPSNQFPNVYGNIETTGAYNSIGPLQGIFDKQQLIDCIQQITAITGYIIRVDEQGAVQFSSPNWWSPGNFIQETGGTYTTQIPVIEELVNLNDYTQTTTDQTTVSQIIVSPVDPYLFGGDPAAVTVTNFIPSGIGNLHGIRKPAMIGTVLNVPITLTDQEVMAELLAIQCYFASRQGQAVAIHNPAICVDDQIQIYDRASAEANTHYVVGVHIEHDLDSGQKLATYSTYWLGSSTTWAINANQNSILAGSQAQNFTYNNEGILVSDQLINFLANTGAKSVQQLVAGATAPTLINPGGPAATSSDIIDPSTIIAEGISP